MQLGTHVHSQSYPFLLFAGLILSEKSTFFASRCLSLNFPKASLAESWKKPWLYRDFPLFWFKSWLTCSFSTASPSAAAAARSSSCVPCCSDSGRSLVSNTSGWSWAWRERKLYRRQKRNEESGHVPLCADAGHAFSSVAETRQTERARNVLNQFWLFLCLSDLPRAQINGFSFLKQCFCNVFMCISGFFIKSYTHNSR